MNAVVIAVNTKELAALVVVMEERGQPSADTPGFNSTGNRSPLAIQFALRTWCGRSKRAKWARPCPAEGYSLDLTLALFVLHEGRFAHRRGRVDDDAGASREGPLARLAP